MAKSPNVRKSGIHSIFCVYYVNVSGEEDMIYAGYTNLKTAMLALRKFVEKQNQQMKRKKDILVEGKHPRNGYPMYKNKEELYSIEKLQWKGKKNLENHCGSQIVYVVDNFNHHAKDNYEKIFSEAYATKDEAFKAMHNLAKEYNRKHPNGKLTKRIHGITRYDTYHGGDGEFRELMVSLVLINPSIQNLLDGFTLW